MTEMKDVDHTHPETADSFGDAFRRGPDVAADGGERSEGPRTSSERSSDGSRDSLRESRNERDAETNDEDDEEEETTDRVATATMEDVDHTTDDDGVDRTFERGTEGRSDAV